MRPTHSFKYLPHLAATLLVLASSLAQAQTIYRIVGPDGRVTFSDKAPNNVEKTTTLGAGGRSPLDAAGPGGMPYELRQIANRFPVTLYTGDNCDPCNSGRALLTARGIPFTERTVTTAEDAEALQQLSGGQASLPLITIGGQRVTGFLNSEWTQYLDAAGYPKSSRLPSGYRNPPVTPLAPQPKPQSVAAEEQQAAPVAPVAAPPSVPPASPGNPAGITF